MKPTKLKLDKQVAQSLTNLRANPDFANFLGWLKGHRDKFQDECCTTEGPPLFRSQGKVFVVDGIEEALEAAPAVTEKFKQR